MTFEQSPTTAAALVGVLKETIYGWLRAGVRKKEPRYREFLDAVNKAMAESEVADRALIREHWRKDGRRLRCGWSGDIKVDGGISKIY